MIKGGAEVKIIDNRSKEDLTSVTLAQIIFEEEKKRSQMPLGVLREIIRHGGEAVAGFYAEKAETIAGKLGELRSKTETIRDDIEQKVRGVTGMFRKEGEVVSPVKEAVDELRGRVDTAVKSVVETFGGAGSAEIDRLQKRIQELEKRIAELTKGARPWRTRSSRCTAATGDGSTGWSRGCPKGPRSWDGPQATTTAASC